MDKPLLEVAIVGAGLGGLALAAGLHQRGIKAHVFEKAAGSNSDTATGISLGRNATRALDGIREGLSDKIKAAASITKTTKVTMCKGGLEPMTVLKENNNSSEDEMYVVKWRSARDILAMQIPDSYIHCSHKLVGYSTSQAADGNMSVELKFETGKNEEVVFLARFVVGADGINSATRKIMVGDEPRDLHLINWNALVYNPGLFKVHDKDQIAIIRCGPSLCYLVDAGEDYTMWVFRVEDRSGEGSGNFGDASVKSRVLKEVDKLIATCEAWKPLRVAVESTEAEKIFERRVRDREPLTSWSDLNQRVLLIGDAAHAMHSGPGQGARTAFEDAHQLSELLSAAYAAGGSDEELKKAVTRFEELRIPRLTKFQKYAAETTAIPEFIPDWVKQLTPAQSMIRMNEFQRWASSYPKNMTGDPQSTYFK